MGEVPVEMVAVHPRTGARSEAMLALADTGATLTVMPGELLDRLGVQRLRRVSLVLADGRRAQRDVGEAPSSRSTTGRRYGSGSLPKTWSFP